MYCSRRLYKGNAYEICLPIADTGITVVRFYTRGDIIIEKEPEISGDSMCFSFTAEELASLEDGVLRYEIVTDQETKDTNSPYVVVTPGDYSGSTLDDLLEDAFDSGYTAGQEDCSGSSCNLQSNKTVRLSEIPLIFSEDAGYYSISGNSFYVYPKEGKDGMERVQIFGNFRPDEAISHGFNEGYSNGYSQGTADARGMMHSLGIGINDLTFREYEEVPGIAPYKCFLFGSFSDSSGYSSVSANIEVTDLYSSAYTSGYTDGFQPGYDSGYTKGRNDQKSYIIPGTFNANGTYTNPDGWSPIHINVPQTGHTDQEMQDSWDSGYTSGKTDGYESGYTAGQEDCSGSSCNLQPRKVVDLSELTWSYKPKAPWVAPQYTISGGPLFVSADSGYDGLIEVVIGNKVYADEAYDDGYGKGFTSGYTAGQEACSGGSCEGIWEDGYDSGFTDGAASVDCTDYFNSGYTSGYTDGNADLIANLQGDYFVIPEGTTNIRHEAFYNQYLTSITIPNTVRSIEVMAFYGCHRLTSITIPDSVQTIENFVFATDNQLQYAIIGSGVTQIGISVFDSCPAVTSITFEGVTPPTINTATTFGSTAYTYPIYVPCESVEAYKTAFGAKYAPRVTCIPGPQPEPVYSAMPLTFEIISGGTIGWDNSQTNVNIEYSINSGQTWQNFTTLNVNAGDKVMFRGTGHTGFDGPDPGTDLYGSRFTASTGTYFNAVGNIHSLLNSNYTGITALGEYGSAVFFGLFSGNTGLVSAENLKLPAQTLVVDCYRDMFACCSNLTTAPELPASDIYWVAGCYMYMFNSCYKLNYIKCLVTNYLTVLGVQWLSGVSPTGTFVKSPGLTEWPVGDSGIPSGWTVVDAQL